MLVHRNSSVSQNLLPCPIDLSRLPLGRSVFFFVRSTRFKQSTVLFSFNSSEKIFSYAINCCAHIRISSQITPPLEPSKLLETLFKRLPKTHYTSLLSHKSVGPLFHYVTVLCTRLPNPSGLICISSKRYTNQSVTQYTRFVTNPSTPWPPSTAQLLFLKTSSKNFRPLI